MRKRMIFALSIAAAMIMLAVFAQMGWADRDAVDTLLLVLPIILATKLLRGRSSCGCATVDAKA